MIYILSLLWFFLLIYVFDIKGKTENRSKWYNILLIWFIVVSGFAYNVGADMPGYMDEYDSYNWSSVNSFGDLADFYHRQPGWVLLNLLCKSFTPNFRLLEIVSACFINLTVFSFIKKHCRYIFIGILFYAIVLYLNMNFNMLRQSYSICFFLIGYDFLLKNKYVKYYIFAFLAFMMHTSAIVCFVIPLALILKINKSSIIVICLSVAALFAVVLSSSFTDLLTSFFSDMLSESGTIQTIGEAGNKFMGSHYERDVSISLFGIIEQILRMFLIVIIIYYNTKFNVNNCNRWNVMLIIYAFCLIMDIAIPVMFYRFKSYFELFYYCSLAFCLVDFPKRYLRSNNALVTSILIIFFSITPVRALLNENPSSGIPLIAQFHPYYSIINKKIDPVRAYHFGSHK